MVTRYFEQPVPVRYRTTRGWRSVLAVGVRGSGEIYSVLITCPFRDTRITWWVPRSQVRPENPDQATSPHGLSVTGRSA
jgi:hypothetical protein